MHVRHVSGKKMAELNNSLEANFLWHKCMSNRLVTGVRFTGLLIKSVIHMLTVRSEGNGYK
jgi:hypothetical protein